MRKLLFALAVGLAALLGTSAAHAQDQGKPLPPDPVAQPQSGGPGVVPGPVVPGPGTPIPGPGLTPLPGPGGPGCGDHGCCVPTKKVCVPEPTTLIVKKVVYGSECKDFCIRKCALCGLLGGSCATCDHGCGTGGCASGNCGDGHGHGGSWLSGLHDKIYCPRLSFECGHPHTKRVLLKRVDEVGCCPDFKCHVEEHPVCSAPCPAPCATPGALPPGTVIPIGPPAGAPPAVGPAGAAAPMPVQPDAVMPAATGAPK